MKLLAAKNTKIQDQHIFIKDYPIIGRIQIYWTFKKLSLNYAI